MPVSSGASAPHPSSDALGDDNLTDEERTEFAARYQSGPAAKPTREQIAELRARLLAASRD